MIFDERLIGLIMQGLNNQLDDCIDIINTAKKKKED